MRGSRWGKGLWIGLEVLSVLCLRCAQANEDGATTARRLLGPLVLAKPLSPHTLGRLTDEAESLYRFGLHRQALEAFEAVTELVPGHAPAWLRIGNVQQTMGRRDRAMSAYRKAVAHSAGSLDPVRRKALFNLGVIHLDEMDKILNALEALDLEAATTTGQLGDSSGGSQDNAVRTHQETRQALQQMSAAREEASDRMQRNRPSVDGATLTSPLEPRSTPSP